MSKDIYAKFDEVYEKTFRLISALATAKCRNLEDVKDIVQQTYAEYFNTLKRYGADYAKNDAAFVVTLLRRALYYHYKKRENIDLQCVSLSAFDDNISGNVDEVPAELRFEVSEDSENVRIVLSELAKKDVQTQKIFALFYYSDIKIKDIAGLLSLSESGVKHKLYDTIRDIKSKLGIS